MQDIVLTIATKRDWYTLPDVIVKEFESVREDINDGFGDRVYMRILIDSDMAADDEFDTPYFYYGYNWAGTDMGGDEPLWSTYVYEMTDRPMGFNKEFTYHKCVSGDCPDEDAYFSGDAYTEDSKSNIKHIVDLWVERARKRYSLRGDK